MDKGLSLQKILDEKESDDIEIQASSDLLKKILEEDDEEVQITSTGDSSGFSQKQPRGRSGRLTERIDSPTPSEPKPIPKVEETSPKLNEAYDSENKEGLDGYSEGMDELNEHDILSNNTDPKYTSISSCVLKPEPFHILSSTLSSKQKQSGYPTTFCISSTFIAIGTTHGFVLVFDHQEKIKIILGTSLGIEFGAVTSLDISRTSEWIVSGHQGAQLILWEINTGKPLKIINDAHSSPIIFVSFLNEKNTIVSADLKGELYQFNVSHWFFTYTIETIKVLGGSAGQVLSLSPLYNGDVPHPIDQFKLISICTSRAMLIVSLHPKVKIQFQLHKPESVRDNTLPYLAWRRILVRDPRDGDGKSTPSSRRILNPMLAVAWDCEISLFQILLPESLKNTELSSSSPSPSIVSDLQLEIIEIGTYQSDTEITGLQWLPPTVLVHLNAKDQLRVFDPFALEELEILDTKFMELVYHTKLSSTTNTICSFHHSFKSFNSKIYLLGLKHTYSAHLLNWEERLNLFLKDGKILEALTLATDFYKGRAKAVVGLPTEVYAQRAIVGKKIEELMVHYVSTQDILYSDQLKGSGSKQQLSRETIRKYRKLADLVIQYSILIKRNELLFTDIFSIFEKQGDQISGVFLESLERYIISDRLRSIPGGVMSSFIQHYKKQNNIEKVEECILHLDISSLDIQTMIDLCQKDNLRSGLIFLYNHGRNDYLTPLIQMMDSFYQLSTSYFSSSSSITSATTTTPSSTLTSDNSSTRELSLSPSPRSKSLSPSYQTIHAKKQNSKERHLEEKIFEIIKYIKYCFRGRAFPRGVIPQNILTDVKKTILHYLFNSTDANDHPHIYHLLIQNTRETLNTLTYVFADSSLSSSSSSSPSSSSSSSSSSPSASSNSSQLSPVLESSQIPPSSPAARLRTTTAPVSSSSELLPSIQLSTSNQLVDHQRLANVIIKILKPNEPSDPFASIYTPSSLLPLSSEEVGLTYMFLLKYFLNSTIQLSSEQILTMVSHLLYISPSSTIPSIVTPSSSSSNTTINSPSILRRASTPVQLVNQNKLPNPPSGVTENIGSNNLLHKIFRNDLSKSNNSGSSSNSSSMSQDGGEEIISLNLDRQHVILKLLETLPSLNDHSEKILLAAEGAGLTLIAEYFYRQRKKYDKVLRCYLKDPQRNKQIFQVISELLSDPTIDVEGREMIKGVVLSSLKDLVSIDNHNVSSLILQYFPNATRDIVYRLEDFPQLQYDYLHAVFHSNRELIERSGVQVSKELNEKYLKLKCEYAPNEVYQYLTTNDNYKLDEILNLCKSKQILDATAYLLERMGDVNSALDEIMKTLESRIQELKASISKTENKTLPPSSGSSPNLDSLSISSELSSSSTSRRGTAQLTQMEQNERKVRYILQMALGLCQRNSHRLDDGENKALWFRVVDYLVAHLRKLRTSFTNISSSPLSSSSGSPGTPGAGRLNPRRVRGRESMALAPVFIPSSDELDVLWFRHFLRIYIKDTLQGMMSSIGLKPVLEKIIYQHGSDEFSEFKPIVIAMLDNYRYEVSILDTVKNLCDRDRYDAMVKLVSKRSSPYPSSSCCQICEREFGEIGSFTSPSNFGANGMGGGGLSSVSSVLVGTTKWSSVVIFRCGHTYHSGCLQIDKHKVCPLCTNVKSELKLRGSSSSSSSSGGKDSSPIPNSSTNSSTSNGSSSSLSSSNEPPPQTSIYFDQEVIDSYLSRLENFSVYESPSLLNILHSLSSPLDIDQLQTGPTLNLAPPPIITRKVTGRKRTGPPPVQQQSNQSNSNGGGVGAKMKFKNESSIEGSDLIDLKKNFPDIFS